MAAILLVAMATSQLVIEPGQVRAYETGTNTRNILTAWTGDEQASIFSRFEIRTWRIHRILTIDGEKPDAECDVTASVTLGTPTVGAGHVESGLMFGGNELVAEWSRGRYRFQCSSGATGYLAFAPSDGHKLSIRVFDTKAEFNDETPPQRIFLPTRIYRVVFSINGTPLALRNTRVVDFSIAPYAAAYRVRVPGDVGRFSGLSVN